MTTIENLDYVRDMARELAQIARSSGFGELGHILEIAESEADRLLVQKPVAQAAKPLSRDASLRAALRLVVPASAEN